MADHQHLVDDIDAVLPQTQCKRCGFEACRPYAKALAEGTTLLNRCPPGGSVGIARLASLLQRPALPLDPECGQEQPYRVAVVDESLCIGCTKCIQACPVDAIVGASKMMHSVVEEQCTGCELCLPPCPVDCITMEAPLHGLPWQSEQASRSRQRFEARSLRLQHETSRVARRNLQKLERKQEELAQAPGQVPDLDRQQALIAKAMATARARLTTPHPTMASAKPSTPPQEA